MRCITIDVVPIEIGPTIHEEFKCKKALCHLVYTPICIDGTWHHHVGPETKQNQSSRWEPIGSVSKKSLSNRQKDHDYSLFWNAKGIVLIHELEIFKTKRTHHRDNTITAHQDIFLRNI